MIYLSRYEKLHRIDISQDESSEKVNRKKRTGKYRGDEYFLVHSTNKKSARLWRFSGLESVRFLDLRECPPEAIQHP